MDPLTPDEKLTIAGRDVTAHELAQARQKLASDSPFNAGFYDWENLSDDEKRTATVDAAGWLRALGALLAGAGDDPMPLFIIKGKDKLAPRAVDAYAQLCHVLGLDWQRRQVELAAEEIRAWQGRNRDLVVLPQHQHQPVGGAARPEIAALYRDAEQHAAELGETPEEYAEG